MVGPTRKAIVTLKQKPAVWAGTCCLWLGQFLDVYRIGTLGTFVIFMMVIIASLRWKSCSTTWMSTFPVPLLTMLILLMVEAVAGFRKALVTVHAGE